MLAERLGATFLDADDFHPPANVAKMRAGQPLDDADRAPWLDALAAELASPAGRIVLACSALKTAYRERLRLAAPDLVTVFLHGDPELIRRRMEARGDHFMPASLMESQLRTLEAPEDALRLDLAEPPELLAEQALAWIAAR
jgi:gluconokinase